MSLFSAYIQRTLPPPPDYGSKYLEMTRQFAAGSRTVHAPAPWVYRIATPWLASFASERQIDRRRPFYIINIASAFVGALLLLIWLRGQPFGVRLLLVTMFLTAWVGPTRYVYFTPMYVDPLFFVFLMVGLLLVHATRMYLPGRTTPLLAALVFVGTFSRESMVLIALAFIACHNPIVAVRFGRWRDVVWTILPLGGALLAGMLLTRIAIPTGPTTEFSLPLLLLGELRKLTWPLTVFFTFGPPVVALVAADARRAVAFLRTHSHLGIYLLGCGALSFFGATDEERILLWAAPVVYLLAARSIDRHRATLRNKPLLLTLAAAQIVSSRVLWPIPTQGVDAVPLSSIQSIPTLAFEVVNRVVVIDSHYNNLWAFWGSRRLFLGLLVYDIAFVALIVVWIRWLERRGARTEPAVALAALDARYRE